MRKPSPFVIVNSALELQDGKNAGSDVSGAKNEPDLHRRLPLNHVGLLTWGFGSARSGLARAANLIAHGLLKQGCDVTVITMDTDKQELRADGRLAVVGARAWETPLDRKLRSCAALGHLVAPKIFLKCLKSIAAVRPFDIIESTNWFAPSLFTRGLKVPVVVRHSTPAFEDYKAAVSPRDALDRFAARRFERRAARSADGWISNTAHHRESIARSYGRPSCEIDDVIALPLDDKLRERGRRSSYPDDSTTNLLYVGRAEERKGFDDVLQGFDALLHQSTTGDRRAPPLLHIVGPSDEDFTAAAQRLSLSRNATSSIIRHDPVSDDDLFALFEQCHVVLAPSRYESFGLIYREATAFGRPVLGVADDPSARQFARQSGAMLVVADRAPRTIVRGIDDLLDNRERRLAIGRAGKVHAQRLTVERFGQDTFDLYQDVRHDWASRRRG